MVSNEYLLAMWKRKIHINDVAKPLYWLNNILRPGCSDFIAEMPSYHWDPYGYYDRFPSHLDFTKKEEERGLAQLKEMGIGPDDPFVCIHVRDVNYLTVTRPYNPKLTNNRRVWDFRDSNVNNYGLAARTLADLGYHVIRMGKHVTEPFSSDHPKIIDYASECQSDFMDVFLASKCTFFIGQNSGGSALPMVFRRPMVFVNIFPVAEIGHCSYTRGISILKKYYSKQLGRYLKFREIFDLGLSQYAVVMPNDIRKNNELDLEILDNSPEEINETVLEMHRYLNSDSRSNQETPEFHDQFLSIVKSYPEDVPLAGEYTRIAVGSHFLKSNLQLLE